MLVHGDRPTAAEQKSILLQYLGRDQGRIVLDLGGKSNPVLGL